MRKLFTTGEFLANHTIDALRWQLESAQIVRVYNGVYGQGGEPVTPLEYAVGSVYGSARTARALVAATIHELDGFGRSVPTVVRTRRPMLAAAEPVRKHGVSVASGLQTVVDIAPHLDDVWWEIANESGLRKNLYTIEQLEEVLDVLSAHRVPGTSRIRRVLALRPTGAPPTESVLETLMIQLIRTIADVPEPKRQVWVYDQNNVFVARVDLCWPDLGIFLELDGEGHKGQPRYDSIRQTRVVTVTGWLPGRFTWTEVHDYPAQTARRLVELVAQAKRLRKIA